VTRLVPPKKRRQIKIS